MLELSTLDLVVIAVYFLAVFGIAWWASKGEKDSTSESTDYFLAGRNLGWFVIGASLFASNIGSEHLIGLAGSGFSEGVAVAQYEIWAGLILLLLGWVFVPFYLSSGVYTMPEFLEKRYNPATRMYLSVISVIAYVLTKISVTIYAGGVVFEAIGFDFWTGAILLVVATGIYTIFGGLKAVVYTDMMQMFVLLGGAIAVTAYGLSMLGGLDEMNRIVEVNGEGFFDMWKPVDHPNYPWTGILFGAPILGVWYWCTDQFIVQRVLSAKNIENARKGTIFAGFLKMLPLFLFVIPGIVAFALVEKGLITVAEPNATLPEMIRQVLPFGLKGLVIAGLFAALMSSLSSVFNSCSTLITLDLYKRFKPDATERRLVFVGQGATALLVVLGLLWIPFMSYFSNQLFLYLQSVQGYISPPIAAVFLLGIFYQRLNGTGAMSALLGGFVLGAARFFMELNIADLTAGTFWYWYASINFLHFAILLFAICVAILVIVSMLTAAPDPRQVANITYGGTTHIKTGASKSNVYLSILLVVIVLILWICFS